MRIGIDVRYLSHGLVGGLHLYIRNSVSALIEQAREHMIYLYADTKRSFELNALPTNVCVRYLPYTSPISSMYHDFFMHRAMERDRVDLAHFPANYGFGPAGARTIITIQDPINLMPMREIIRGHSKSIRTLGMMTYLHYCTRAALIKADLITTVSAFSGAGIAHHGRITSGKIVVVPSACPTDMQRIQDSTTLADVRRRLALTRPFILAEAFKNPAILIEAWKELPRGLRDAHEIVFFSRSPKVLPIVRQAIANGFARLLVRPARTDLAALYSMAGIFVFPSWIEGFGLPVLEAMACGSPVIASDRGSIPEVASDAAILVDAEDAGALAHQIQQVLTTPMLAESLRERGLARAAQFSWKRNAEMTLECYRRVLHHKVDGK